MVYCFFPVATTSPSWVVWVWQGPSARWGDICYLQGLKHISCRKHLLLQETSGWALIDALLYTRHPTYCWGNKTWVRSTTSGWVACRVLVYWVSDSNRNNCKKVGQLFLSVSVFKINLLTKTRGNEQSGLALVFHLWMNVQQCCWSSWTCFVTSKPWLNLPELLLADNFIAKLVCHINKNYRLLCVNDMSTLTRIHSANIY